MNHSFGELNWIVPAKVIFTIKIHSFYVTGIQFKYRQKVFGYIYV